MEISVFMLGFGGKFSCGLNPLKVIKDNQSHHSYIL
jgi:hypothetical protein